MAILGKWTGGTIGTLVPTDTWAAPNGMFPTETRNDSSTYTFTSSTSTLTLPSSGLADGYLIVASYEFEDSSNGRHNPQGRLIQASGTGTFVGAQTGGYSRDNSEDRAYVKCWGFVDNPSASSTYQFQWKRDSDSPNSSDGTVRSSFEVIPFYYSDIGLYSSTTSAQYGGTTPSQVTGFSGTDGTNITISSDVVSVTGDNKRYLALGSFFEEDISSGNRTQRWAGFEIDSSFENAAKGYAYWRTSADEENGIMFTWLIETATATRTIQVDAYTGDGTANGDGGADSDGAGSGTNAAHAMVVIELNDSAEVFQTVDETGAQNIATTGPIDLNVSRTTDLNFNDSASWTRSTDTAMNAVQDMDALLGANVSLASEDVSTGQRFTFYSEFTVNGTEDASTFHGNYIRNNQSSQDTFGGSANLLSFVGLTSGDDVGVSATELSGSEGGAGAQHTQAGWVGFWGVNLDTLEASAGSISPSISPSPSPGWEGYTRGSYAALPTDDSELETAYSGQDYTDIDTSDNTRVDQTATGEYALHQFKDFTADSSCHLEWEGQSNLAPSSSTVYLQIYNRDTGNWETVDSDSSTAADTDFSLTADIQDLTDYKDASNVISCRVYQLET